MTDARKSNALIALLSALLFCGGLMAVSLGPSLQSFQFTSVMLVVTMEFFWVAVWLAAAWGWGVPLRRALLRSDSEVLLQLAFGAGTLMLLDWILGSCGLLNSVSGWVLTVMGIVGGIVDYSATKKSADLATFKANWCWLLLMPSLGLICGAATVAPGALWFSEFSGWDALAYHLQLPLEWHALGRISGLPNNVYSYLPDIVEASSLHLAFFRGGMHAATFSAQILQSAFAAATALTLGRAVTLIAARSSADNLERSNAAGLVAAAVYLALPWTTITGSLAFVEQSMAFFASAAVLLLLKSELISFRTALAIGVLCGYSALAKVSAAFLVATPCAIILIVFCARRFVDRATLGAAFVLGAVLVCAPWLIRNALLLSNPIFPGGSEIFGSAHWSAEQAQRFNHTFRQHFGAAATLGKIWHAFVRGSLFGHVLFPFATVATVMLFLKTELRRATSILAALALIQTAMWAAFTHQMERFLIPIAIPLAMLAGLLASAGRVQKVCALLLVAALTTSSYRCYFIEPGTPTVAIDGVEFMMAEAQPYKALNTLPPGSKVYAEGFATPYYVNAEITYHTVWDASPLGAAFKRGGPAEAKKWLTQSGYTHLIIDWNMLETWLAPGNYGYDSNITIPALLEFVAPLPRLYESKVLRCSIYGLR